ncbi:hypothetical protein PV08_08254 [Exophiala spinifera]|uniref:Survival Motor Neuron Gemin2-binding domain-containing protein n=1 Tax=Exophiala spinifera TaxID=91928 RepID=A0A0D1ZJT4_9EURO|nr:uncharacterized protein PV08_08254 [Exophiala spinifera]KIW13067.1 hypothetical protein PV08_08254 [Exophiala spinifera]
MPRRSKKAKTNHHSSKQSGGDLSQAEIWDDSALIRSWNDAVAEYEYYHSIHARGEDVEEILRRAENGELDDDNVDDASGAGADVSGEWHDVNQKPVTAQNSSVPADDDDGDDYDDDEIEDGEVEDSELMAAKAALSQKVQIHGSDNQSQSSSQQPATAAITSTTTPSVEPPQQGQDENTSGHTSLPTIGPSLPTTSDQQGPLVDQTLENIKMAYYWAGYYSGLYDGQRQAQGASTADNVGPS